MQESLYHLAHQYVDVMDRIERTKDRNKLQSLEEKRVELHWMFMDALKKHGIKYNDREHATRIAYRIANGEI